VTWRASSSSLAWGDVATLSSWGDVAVVVVPGVDDVAVVVLVVDPAWPNRGLSPRGHSPATTTVGMVVVGKRGGGGKERVMLDQSCPIWVKLVLPIIIYNY